MKNLTTQLIEIWVYSTEVVQQKYECYLKAKDQKFKIAKEYELKEYVENWINNLLRPMFGFKSSLEMVKLAS